MKSMIQNKAAPFIDEKVSEKLGVDDVRRALDVRSPYGARALRNFSPFMPGDEADFKRHFKVIEDLRAWLREEAVNYGKVSALLSKIEDIDGYIDTNDWPQASIFIAKKTIKRYNEIQRLLASAPKTPASFVVASPFEKEAALGDFEFNEKGFALPDGFSQKLKSLRDNARNIRGKLEKLKNKNRKAVFKKINLLENPAGEFIVDRSSEALLAKLLNFDGVNVLSEFEACVHFRVRESEAELKLARELSGAMEKQRNEENRIYKKLGGSINKKSASIKSALNKIGELDMLLAVAEWAEKNNAVTPVLAKNILKVNDAVFLPLKAAQESRGENYTPVNIETKQPGAVITGSNMGGKTTSLFTIGFLQALSQYGLPVPAKEFRTALRENIFLCAADEDRPDDGLSAFGREIDFIKSVLLGGAGNALVLMDEPGRTTNAREGRAIFLAFIERLAGSNSMAVVTTHDEKLAALSKLERFRMAGLKPGAGASGLKSGAGAVRKLMDYRLLRDESESAGTDAIKVARLMGLASPLVKRALELLENEEGTQK